MLQSRTAMLALATFTTLTLVACGGDKAAEESGAAAADASAAGAMMADAGAGTMETFMITLSGAAERPTPVTTKAQAEATIMVHPDSIVYAVNGLDLMGVTGVHIHRGGVEEAGPVIAALFKSETGEDVANGSIAIGTITRETALPEGTTLESLAEAIRTGQAYVNIHTKGNPGGELRGQTTGGGMM